MRRNERRRLKCWRTVRNCDYATDYSALDVTYDDYSIDNDATIRY